MTSAAQKTPVLYPFQGTIPINGLVTKTYQADWMFVPYPGVNRLQLTIYTGALDTFTFGTASAAADSSTGDAIAAVTGTKLNVTSAPVNRLAGQGFYILNNNTGEVMYVIADSARTSATATLTVIRGCLGTTATAITASDTMYILNCITLAGSTTGYIMVSFDPMPPEPKANQFV